MSRRYAQKRVQYVRAVFNQAEKAQTLESSLRAALKALPKMHQTQVKTTALGTLAVTHRDVADSGFVFLAIGAASENEMMATMGFNVDHDVDADMPQPAAAGRGWKVADAFLLVDDNEVLLVTDGGMRISAVEGYLRKLLEEAAAAPEQQAFGLIARTARKAQRTLDAEGIKEIKLHSTAYAASEVLDGTEVGTGNWLQSGWQGFLRGIREAFEEEARNDAEREAIINHLADLNISAVVNVKGGIRGEPTVVRSLEEVAKDAFGDAPEGTDITLITRKGNSVSVGSLVLSTTKNIRRRNGQNALDHTDAWEKIRAYRTDLVKTARWRE